MARFIQLGPTLLAPKDGGRTRGKLRSIERKTSFPYYRMHVSHTAIPDRLKNDTSATLGLKKPRGCAHKSPCVQEEREKRAGRLFEASPTHCRVETALLSAYFETGRTAGAGASGRLYMATAPMTRPAPRMKYEVGTKSKRKMDSTDDRMMATDVAKPVPTYEGSKRGGIGRDEMIARQEDLLGTQWLTQNP